MPDTLTIALACNDEHGNMTDAIEHASIDVRGELVELEGPELIVRWCSATERHEHGYDGPLLLKLYGGPSVPAKSLRKYVGNLLWDAVMFDEVYALRLLNWLRQSAWTCNAGPTELFEVWNADHQKVPAITAEMLS